MELSAPPRGLPTLPHRQPFTPNSSFLFLPRPIPSFSHGKALSSRSKPGLVCSDARWSGFKTSEETSSTTGFGTDSDSAAKKRVEEASFEVAPTEEGSPTEEGIDAMDFLNKLNVELNPEDVYPLLVYGSGALVALWVSSAIVSALDSIPVFPKMMEVVGLGFTVWFSSRYIIFKKNRDELFAQIYDLKEQILGPGDK